MVSLIFSNKIFLINIIVVSKGVSPKGVTHMHLCIFTIVRYIRGDLASKPRESHRGYTQRGGAYTIQKSRKGICMKAQLLVASTRGEAGIKLKPGS